MAGSEPPPNCINQHDYIDNEDENDDYNSVYDKLQHEKQNKFYNYYKTKDINTLKQLQQLHSVDNNNDEKDNMEVTLDDLDDEDKILLSTSIEQDDITSDNHYSKQYKISNNKSNTKLNIDIIHNNLNEMLRQKQLNEYIVYIIQHMLDTDYKAYKSQLIDIQQSIQTNNSNNTMLIEYCMTLFKAIQYKIYNTLYSETSVDEAKTLSLQDRKQVNYDNSDNRIFNSSLVYGEVSYDALYDILYSHDSILAQYLKQKTLNELQDMKFIDLGSGSGKCVTIVSLLTSINIDGIELLPGLYNMSYNIINKYKNDIIKNIQCNNDICKLKSCIYDKQSINVYLESIYNYDFSDYDIIFINSTCFDSKLMMYIQNEINNKCKLNTYIITYTKSIHNNDNIKLLQTMHLNQSWGKATVYICQKIT